MNMNFNNLKIATIIKILLLILLAVTGYFTWKSFQKPAELHSKQTLAPQKNQLKVIGTSSFSKEWQLFAPTRETAAPFFETVYETAETIKTKIENEIAASARTAQNTSPSNEIILSLTADEFHFLYPDSFIKSLIDAQDLFVKNIDPSYAPLLKIETDAQVRLVEEKIVAALVSLDMLNAEQARSE